MKDIPLFPPKEDPLEIFNVSVSHSQIEAMDIIEKINSENNRKLVKIKVKKIKPQKITLKSCEKDINFKLYEDV